MESSGKVATGKMKVAIDTNMLTAILEFKIDVFDEIRKLLGNVEFIVLKQTLDELGNIAKRKGLEARKAKFALEVIKKEKFTLEEIEARNCDDALLKISDRAIIATNDKELKGKVIQNKGKVIFIRQKKIIGLEG